MFWQQPAVCRPAILLVGFISHPAHIPLACPARLSATEPGIDVAPFTSVLRPGTFRTCAALPSTSSKESSRTCHTGFQENAGGFHGHVGTAWMASQSDSASNPLVGLQSSALHSAPARTRNGRRRR